MAEGFNSYELSRSFFDFTFSNPEKIKPNHVAMYFFAIEHCNRLGWKEKFGFPSTMVMEAIGIKSYNTYIGTLNDLVNYGFIKMIEKSKNQYSANIIALSKFNNAQYKALDKALIKHCTKQSESTSESIDSIDKQYNHLTIEQYNKLTKEDKSSHTQQLGDFDFEDSVKTPEPEKEKSCAKKENPKAPDLAEFLEYAKQTYQNELKRDFSPFEFAVRSKYESWINADWKDGNGKQIKNWKSKLKNTIPHLKPIYNGTNNYTAGAANGNYQKPGKTSARTVLAQRLNAANATNGESGNITIDIEAQ